jgi:hypothetical protein
LTEIEVMEGVYHGCQVDEFEIFPAYLLELVKPG